jgi:hypothetical protein
MSDSTTEFMTSWEIASEVNKTHANVLRDIRSRLQSRGIDHELHRAKLPDHRGYRRWAYLLPRGLAVELMSRYSTTVCREQGAKASDSPTPGEDQGSTLRETRLDSREIAALAERPHHRVLRDIRRELKKHGEAEALYRNDRPDGKGVFRPVFELPRTLVQASTSMYPRDLPRRVMARWTELNVAWLQEQELLREQRRAAELAEQVRRYDERRVAEREARRNAPKSIPLHRSVQNGHDSKEKAKSSIINVVMPKRANFIK